MERRLVIDGDSVYEIDEICMERKRKNEDWAVAAQRPEDTKEEKHRKEQWKKDRRKA